MFFSEETPGADTRKSELTDILTQQVIGNQIPLSMHIKEMIRMHHPLCLLSAPGSKIEHIDRMAILNGLLQCHQCIWRSLCAGSLANRIMMGQFAHRDLHIMG